MQMGSQVAIVQQQRSVREQQLSAFVFGDGVGRGKSGRGGKLGIFARGDQRRKRRWQGGDAKEEERRG
jgi:hypothetical protein